MHQFSWLGDWDMIYSKLNGLKNGFGNYYKKLRVDGVNVNESEGKTPRG